MCLIVDVTNIIDSSIDFVAFRLIIVHVRVTKVIGLTFMFVYNDTTKITTIIEVMYIFVVDVIVEIIDLFVVQFLIVWYLLQVLFRLLLLQIILVGGATAFAVRIVFVSVQI